MIFLILALLSPIILVLYSCLRVSTYYDRQTDDQMQEQFLRRFREKHQKNF